MPIRLQLLSIQVRRMTNLAALRHRPAARPGHVTNGPSGVEPQQLKATSRAPLLLKSGLAPACSAAASSTSIAITVATALNQCLHTGPVLHRHRLLSDDYCPPQDY